MLDEHAHSLPGTLSTLQMIEKQLAHVQRDLDSGQPVADKLHRTVKAYVQTEDTR